MVSTRGAVRCALLLMAATMIGGVVPATAAADGLGDYLWQRRPLLVFSPADNDSRLTETLSRVDATRCDFTARDIVLGVLAARGTSTIDGRTIGAGEAQRLRDQYAIGKDAFTVVLIGKDGGEKRRVDGVPDLRSIYMLIDGMPMRGGDTGGSPRC